jgi:hypothetical protein
MSGRLETLRTELLTDPLSRGYSTMTDQQAADSLNTVDRPAPDMETISNTDLYEAIDRSEYNPLTENEKDRLRILLGLETIRVASGDQGRAEILALFGAGTTTRANLIALATGQLQSRATELGLPTVRVGHVEDARR